MMMMGWKILLLLLLFHLVVVIGIVSKTMVESFQWSTVSSSASSPQLVPIATTTTTTTMHQRRQSNFLETTKVPMRYQVLTDSLGNRHNEVMVDTNHDRLYQSTYSTPFRTSNENVSDPTMNVTSHRRRKLFTYPSILATWMILGWTGNDRIGSAQATTTTTSFLGWSTPTTSAQQQQQRPSLYALAPQRNATTLRTQQSLDTQLFPNGATNSITTDPELTVELCLLRLLPVKNKFFRELQTTLENLTPILRPDVVERTTTTAPAAAAAADPWVMMVMKSIPTNGIAELDRKRTLLEPVFNPDDDDDTLLQISKGERFEILMESLRSRFLAITEAAQQHNRTAALIQQKRALLLLSEIGELLVTKFPYPVPTEGRFSYLPRLLGRCKVTFTFRRQKTILGNITIVADGYMAPITAGNFVDLCMRDFYTGLPIKFMKKRLGSGSTFEVANLPILGSFNDGFYDPLTAKLRRLPLEIIRVGKGSGEPDLTYSQGLSTLSESLLQPMDSSRPLLSFKIPKLVAMNHPDNKPNGGSSEFFSLQDESVLEEKRSYLDGEYAPFGWIVEGCELFQKLRANDVIEETKVSEFGKLNLVKLRRSSFSEVVQGTGESSKDETNQNDVA
jgi:cyclophilin family peptidyl-prolyl cis-trans isomerase